MLKFENISFSSDNTDIIKNINLHITQGDCISIIGPSGSGKSTFLKLCSHLISPKTGRITYKEKSYDAYNPISLRKEISYCVQSPILFGDTVYDNLIFPYQVRKKTIDKERIYELLEAFNLNQDYLIKSINSLSGGEKQRISLIRNLIFLPEILLLDEATSALDNENALIVQSYIKNLNESGLTVLWVTHSLDQSSSIFNKRLILSQGEIEKMEVFN